MYLNGVILVSPTGLGIDRDGPVEAANRLPYFAAAAWYQQALSAELQQKDLDELLEEAESFYDQRIASGNGDGRLSARRKEKTDGGKNGLLFRPFVRDDPSTQP